MATFFDEEAHAGREHLDPGYVAAYDRKAGTDYGAEVERLRELGLGSAATLVDLRCGTAGLAIAAAPHCRRVVGVDVSQAMLDAAAAKDPPGNVELVRAGFLTYEHRGDAPSFVYSRNALHHLPDLWKVAALQRVAEILAPGGLFLLQDFIFSFEPGEEREALGAWLERAPADPAAGWTRSQLEAHLQEEHSTYTWLLEPMIERAGLELLSVECSQSKVYAEYVLSSRG